MDFLYTYISGGGHKDGPGCRADWRKAQAVAHIIASCPSQASSVDDYYQRVCPQVHEAVVSLEEKNQPIQAAPYGIYFFLVICTAVACDISSLLLPPSPSFRCCVWCTHQWKEGPVSELQLLPSQP